MQVGVLYALMWLASFTCPYLREATSHHLTEVFLTVFYSYVIHWVKKKITYVWAFKQYFVVTDVAAVSHLPMWDFMCLEVFLFTRLPDPIHMQFLKTSVIVFSV